MFWTIKVRVEKSSLFPPNDDWIIWPPLLPVDDRVISRVVYVIVYTCHRNVPIFGTNPIGPIFPDRDTGTTVTRTIYYKTVGSKRRRGHHGRSEECKKNYQYPVMSSERSDVYRFSEKARKKFLVYISFAFLFSVDHRAPCRRLWKQSARRCIPFQTKYVQTNRLIKPSAVCSWISRIFDPIVLTVCRRGDFRFDSPLRKI